MIQNKIYNLIDTALENLGMPTEHITVEHPQDLKMGDYSTNVAMALAKDQKSNPKDLAEKIVAEINKNPISEVAEVKALGGFINFHLNKYFFQDSIKQILDAKSFGANNFFVDKKFMIDYTQPNPFKPFHIGHLMTNAIGESIARVIEFSGGKVFRANYQGDVGLHVAKAIYILSKNLPEYTKNETNIPETASLIGQAYVKGSEVYEKDEAAKKEIDEINKKIYDKSDDNINAIYDWGFKITMEAFEEIYKLLGTKFEYYFLESEMVPVGLQIVKENIGKVFSHSEGAVVFKAEEHDSKLHTRVFITKTGLPTYEAKELGLTDAKFKTVPELDLSIVTTATEQADYMKVVTKAISLINPEYGNKMKHATHGMMRFKSGKMSSRLGNVITGESLLRDMRKLVEEKMRDSEINNEEKEKIISAVTVAAIKYGILKQSTGGDIIFDIEAALSFEGDSGPYLQYSYARARSILEKAKAENLFPNFDSLPEEVTEAEKILYRFPEIVLRSVEEFEPHYIANYLIELARAYNSFYGQHKIVDKNDLTSPYKLAFTEAYSIVLKNGLHLLGIQAPEKM